MRMNNSKICRYLQSIQFNSNDFESHFPEIKISENHDECHFLCIELQQSDYNFSQNILQDKLEKIDAREVSGLSEN